MITEAWRSVDLLSIEHGPLYFQEISRTSTSFPFLQVGPTSNLRVFGDNRLVTAVHVMQCLGQLDTPPKFFLHAQMHIATAHPVFLLPYYGLRKRSIAMCVS